MEREFTVAEANAMLPELAARVSALRAAHAALLAAGAGASGHSGNGSGARAVAEAAAREAFDAALADVLALRVVVRDPATGIVDFPARRDGEPIYLCWRPGETAVGHWHGRDDGFAGRQPL